MLYILTIEFLGVMVMGICQKNWGLAMYGGGAALIQVSVIAMGR